MTAMTIRPAAPDDHAILLDIWLRSVRVTHTFLPEEDVQFFHPFVAMALAPGGMEVWVLCDEFHAPIGWMGLDGAKLEALFLDPDRRGQGGGRQMVQHARALKGPLTLDVNEQNPEARAFYERCGFEVVGRSPLDGTGRPYPLLHMQERATTAKDAETAAESRGRSDP